MPEKSSQLGGYFAVAILYFVGIFTFAKWGPAIPLSINQVTTTQDNLFTVNGTGKVIAKPDIAEINIGISAQGSSVTQVQSQANSTINSVSSAIKNLGIPEKDIQTTGYNLQPNYDYTVGRQTIRGYSANINLLIKVRDFNKINQVIDAATGNGANQVGGLTFAIDDPTMLKLQSDARKQAIDQAKKKASEIASQTGITLGKIINISEGSNPTPRPIPMMAKADTEGGPSVPTQIEPGSSEISVTVTLSYETR